MKGVMILAVTKTRAIWNRYWDKQWADQKKVAKQQVRKNLYGEIIPVNGFYSTRLNPVK